MKTQRKTHNLKDNSQAGFTLVELIVSLVILGIVLTVAGNVLFFGTRMYTQTEVRNSEKYVGDNVLKYIQQELEGAIKINVCTNTTPDSMYNKQISVDNYLKNTTDGDMKTALGNIFYGNDTVKVQIKVPEAKTSTHDRNDLMEISVHVFNKAGEDIYQTNTTMKNLNCTVLVDGNVDGADNDKIYDNPTIAYRTDELKGNVGTAVTIANTLCTDYIALYQALWDYKTENPSATLDGFNAKYTDWSTVNAGKTFDQSVSDECITKYLMEKYYGGTWREIRLTSTDTDNFGYVNNDSTKMYVHVTCNLDGYDTGKGRDWASTNCFAFISSQANTQTDGNNWYFVVDSTDSQVYVTGKTSQGGKKMGANYSILKQDFTTVKTKLGVESDWKKFN